MKLCATCIHASVCSRIVDVVKAEDFVTQAVLPEGIILEVRCENYQRLVPLKTEYSLMQVNPLKSIKVSNRQL